MGLLALADVAERDRAAGPADTAPLAVARVYENYLQVVVRDSAAVLQLTDLEGMRVSIGPGWIGRCGDQRGAVRRGRPWRSSGHGEVPAEGWTCRLADGSLDALVWSGGVPTPAISEVDATVPLRMLDIGQLAAPMARLLRLPLPRPQSADRTLRATRPAFHRRAEPAAVPPGHGRGHGRRRGGRTRNRRTATGAPYVRGLQYLDPPSMIQTGLIPLHPGAINAYRKLHG